MSERDETREAVARAIYEAESHPKAPNLHFDDRQGLWQNLADAATGALRIGSRFTVEGVECVVVPVEPSKEMLEAGRGEFRSYCFRYMEGHPAVYRAMLRACEEKGR